MSAKGKGAPAPKQEVAVAQGTNLAMPDYLKDLKGSGLSNVDSTDLIIPRAKILQATSAEPEAFENAIRGEWWINMLDIPLGPRFRFIVCSYKKRALLMRPIDDKSGTPILARSEDGITWNTLGEWDVKIKNVKVPVKWAITDLNVRKSGLLEFGTSLPDDKDSNPAATLFREFLIYLLDYPDVSPIVMSLARTAGKPGKDLVSKIEFKNKPSTAQVYEGTTFKKGEGTDAYWMPVFASAGWADLATKETCDGIADKFKDYIAADETGAANEGVPKTEGTGDRGSL